MSAEHEPQTIPVWSDLAVELCEARRALEAIANRPCMECKHSLDARAALDAARARWNAEVARSESHVNEPNNFPEIAGAGASARSGDDSQAGNPTTSPPPSFYVVTCGDCGKEIGEYATRDRAGLEMVHHHDLTQHLNLSFRAADPSETPLPPPSPVCVHAWRALDTPARQRCGRCGLVVTRP